MVVHTVHQRAGRRAIAVGVETAELDDEELGGPEQRRGTAQGGQLGALQIELDDIRHAVCTRECVEALHLDRGRLRRLASNVVEQG